MPIPVQCPRCSKIYNVRDEMAGQQVRCQCGNVLTIPQPEQMNTALLGLLEEELSRPADPPPKRKTPMVLPPKPKLPPAPQHAPGFRDPTIAPEKSFDDPFASPAERAVSRKRGRPAHYNEELHLVFLIITGVAAILFAVGAGIITGTSAARATDGISELHDLQELVDKGDSKKSVFAFMDYPLMLGAWLMLLCSVLVGVAGIGILCRQYWAKSLGTIGALLILLGIWGFHGYVAILAIEAEAYEDDKKAPNEWAIRTSYILVRIYVADTKKFTKPSGLLGFLDSDEKQSLAMVLIKIILWGLLYSLAPGYIMWWMIWAAETDLNGW